MTLKPNTRRDEDLLRMRQDEFLQKLRRAGKTRAARVVDRTNAVDGAILRAFGRANPNPNPNPTNPK